MYPKRYFVIDYTSANVYIKHDKSIHINAKSLKANKIKIVPFRSILDCFLPTT